MEYALIFVGGFFSGVLFTLLAGLYLSTKLDDIENHKL